MPKIKKPRKKISTKIFKFINFVLFVLFFIVSGFFIYSIINTNMLPTHYIVIIGAVLAILLIIHLILTVKNKRVFSIILDILLSLIAGVQLFAIPKMNEVIHFLDVNFNIKYEVSVFNIMVSTSSSYETIDDLKGQTVLLFNDTDNKEIEDRLKEKIADVNIKPTEDIMNQLTKLKKDKKNIIVADASFYDTMYENDLEFGDKVKIIDTIEIKVKIDKDDSRNVNVTMDPFVIYISGIDTRSNSMPTRSLSDVNILMAVNPKTKKILLIHTPRDYYVQLHGTTGLKDKLTHAGTKKGGINSSKATIEDLYNTTIPFYMRVNFNSVIKIVDAIGGIDIYNDQSYTVRSYVDSSCSYKPGVNKNVKGRCALAFARERHAYQSGDRHRGENQEQVISKIIEKITSSKILLNKYSDILSSLNNSFETNIDKEQITSLVKMQLNDMATWNIETYNVSGTGSMEFTYSYPNQRLYVMKPNTSDVETARKKLEEVLSKK